MTQDSERPLDPTRAAFAQIHRRHLLLGGVALGTAGALLGDATPASAQQASGAPGTEFVIRGGHVLTMDESLGDFPVGDVHVRDGIIVAVGESLDLPGVEVLDATDMIVMPGFVDSHSHLWNAFLRGSVRGDDQARGYFGTTNRAAPLVTPEIAADSVRFGLMESLLSGTTTVLNYNHNTRSVAQAEAEINAALDVGSRTIFAYGGPGRGEPLDLQGLEEVVTKWKDTDPLVSLAINPSSGTVDDTLIAEFAAARSLGIPIALHGSGPDRPVAMADAGLLGPDVLMIHMQGFTEADRAIMAANNVKFSTSPAIEIPYSTVRSGYVQFDELEKLGVVISLSVDASSAMATADFFTVMRALLWTHKQRGDVDRASLTPKRVVEIATLGGAQALWLDDRTGSLTPGKEADIIFVRMNDFNMVPVIDPYYSLVYSGGAHNVDTVIVRGRVLLRDGKHSTLDIGEIARIGGEAGRRMHEQLEEIIAKG